MIGAERGLIQGRITRARAAQRTGRGHQGVDQEMIEETIDLSDQANPEKREEIEHRISPARNGQKVEITQEIVIVDETIGETRKIIVIETIEERGVIQGGRERGRKRTRETPKKEDPREMNPGKDQRKTQKRKSLRERTRSRSKKSSRRRRLSQTMGSGLK